MTPTPSSRDVKQLSAYLDGQLTSSEITKLEARLQSDPEFASGLKDLHEARDTLRQLPQRRAPRNFTLTPEMVGLKPPMPNTYPVFRLASVLATLLFFFTFATNLMAPRFVQTAVPLANGVYFGADTEMLMEAEPEEPVAPAEQADAIQPAPAVEKSTVPRADVSPSPTERFTIGAGVEEPAAPPDVTEPGSGMQETYAFTTTPAPAQTEGANTMTDDDSARVEATPQPSEKSGVVPGEVYAQEIPALETPQREPAPSIYPTVQIVLAGIAVGCALIAFTLRFFAIRKWRAKTK